jgi:hypothetical protein
MIWKTDFYQGISSPSMKAWYLELREQNGDFSGIKTTRDQRTATELLCHYNEKAPENELISVYSEKLSKLKGVFDCAAPYTVLGFDVVNLGHWSLLAEGYFLRSEFFAGIKREINRHGLLRSPEATEQVVESYQHAVLAGALEEFPPPVYGFDTIQVCRLELNG